MRFIEVGKALLFGAILAPLCLAQNPLTSSPDEYFSKERSAQASPATVSGLPLRIWHDQKKIWTSPFHLKAHDLVWLVPAGATLGTLLATDHTSIERIHSNTSNRSTSANLSNAGLGVFVGAAALSFGVGTLSHDSHLRETGLLTTEALADSFLVTEALKLVSQRDRPMVDNAQGQFWRVASINSSFPSEHSALAWSSATVIAHEYPGALTQWFAYGLAAVVSISRVTAEQHFPSDVLVGAASGYLIGRYVYKAHHDPEETTTRRVHSRIEPLLSLVSGPIQPVAQPKASVYVPLDSWVYPALRRLADFGLIPDQVSDLAPWTRAECLRQTQQAADRLAHQEDNRISRSTADLALHLVADLRAELDPESGTGNIIRLESVYTRFTGIAGTPLRDSYHFGQTNANDFGRPFDRGFNNITGFSSYATSGLISAYVRGEYQSAPGRSESSGVQQFISRADLVPALGNGVTPSTSRFQPLEMYVGAQVGAENITFGQQNLWWGPGEQSAFSFSDNAQPFYMLRFAQTRPLILPGPFRYLGKIRTDLVFGKLSGHQFPARPYVDAQKISLDLTDNLEIGFTRSSFFGGGGHPLTLGALGSTLFGVNSVDTGAYGLRSDTPGDRHSGFDFRWRVPGVRHYLTVYSDSYADDEPNPIDNPRRSAWSPGLYISHFPKLEHLDLRFETYSTLLYAKDFGGNFLYWNTQYRDSYTDNGYLLGSWIGRDSRAYIGESSYWFSAKSKLTATYKQIKAGRFLPGGGTQTDVSLAGTWGVGPEWLVSGRFQGERYDIPILGSARQDFVTSIGLIYTPADWALKAR